MQVDRAMQAWELLESRVSQHHGARPANIVPKRGSRKERNPSEAENFKNLLGRRHWVRSTSAETKGLD